MPIPYCHFILENHRQKGWQNKKMEKIDIVPMSQTDLEKLSPILLTDFDDFWNVSVLQTELTNPNSYYFVAKCSDTIVGFAGIWKAVDDVHITDIVVRKDFRNLGIGSQLLEHLIDKSRQLPGIQSITLEVKQSNTIAQKLYQKYGFVSLGMRKNYYGLNENAVIMTLFFEN